MTSPHILGVVKDFLVLCFLKYVQFLAYESQKTQHLKSSTSLQSVNKYSKLDERYFVCTHMDSEWIKQGNSRKHNVSE